MDSDIEALAERHGGYWGEHLRFPHTDWVAHVINNETRRGYWEWVEARVQDDLDNGEIAEFDVYPDD